MKILTIPNSNHAIKKRIKSSTWKSIYYGNNLKKKKIKFVIKFFSQQPIKRPKANLKGVSFTFSIYFSQQKKRSSSSAAKIKKKKNSKGSSFLGVSI